jgi:hypothetical protein
MQFRRSPCRTGVVHLCWTSQEIEDGNDLLSSATSWPRFTALGADLHASTVCSLLPHSRSIQALEALLATVTVASADPGRHP